jgi:D-xylonolactonase
VRLATGNYVIRAEHRSLLGEGPVWSSRDDSVYWVDILAPAVHRLNLADGSVASFEMPERIGWIIERENKPGFIAGFQSGFAALSLEPFVITPIADPEPGLPDNRLNDAKVDHFGRIWAGTMDCDIRGPTGALYRLEPDLSVSRQDQGYLVSNGPAFSVRGDFMYHSDTPLRRVYRFPLSSRGDPGERGVFIEFRREWGLPDGMTVDSEDHLWIAHWGGGRISRFSPDGELERSIRLPASRITSCVFAGPDLDRMIVTSAADGTSGEPDAGKLFEVCPGVTGVRQPRFAG